MRSKFKWIFTLLLALSMQFSFAQEKTVTGVISDKSGPLPGANVIVKGTNRSAQADFDGKFSIKAKQGEVLVVSFVGMADAKVVVGAANTLNVVLLPDSLLLNEVVVQGYGKTETKARTIGAVQTVSSKTIANRPNVNVLQSLQGQLAGTNIALGSGQPGTNKIDVIIRGESSLNASTDPLYVIDGIPLTQAFFRNLNPNDVESVTVLKDASATAIYGNRGTNGVILITTKRAGYEESMSINYSSSYGTSEFRGDKYNLVNAKQHLKLQNLYGDGPGATGSDNLGIITVDPNNIDAYGVNTNWKDVFFRIGTTQSHDLSITSGGKNMSNYTSVGYYDQQGIVPTTAFKRFTVRSNFTGKSNNDKFNYGLNIGLTYSKRNQLEQETRSTGSTSINNNVLQNPLQGYLTSAAYYSPSTYVSGQQLFNDFGSPSLDIVPFMLMDLLVDKHAPSFFDEYKTLVSANMGYKLTKDLTYSITAGVDYTEDKRVFAIGPEAYLSVVRAVGAGQAFHGLEQQRSQKEFMFDFVNRLNYKRVFAEKHTLDISGYTEYLKAHRKTFVYQQIGLNPLTWEPGAGTGYVPYTPSSPQSYIPTTGASEVNAGTFSYFGTVDYDYDSKYGFAATLRRDASYKFVADNKWGTFWSVAGRWNISKENFMKDNSIIKDLKLRASYGTTGNQNISARGADDSQSTIFYNSRDTRSLNSLQTTPGYNNATSFGVQTYGNEDLRWETTSQFNVGIDFNIKSRLSGSFDWYSKETTDLYMAIPVSYANGIPLNRLDGNNGALRNQGYELSLKYDILKDTKFKLSVYANGAFNDNEISSLGLLDDGSHFLRVDNDYAHVIGQTAFQYFNVPYLGVNPINGNLLFKDINGNPTESPTDADRRTTNKNYLPKYQGGFGFNTSYEGFFLDAAFVYSKDFYKFDTDYTSLMDIRNVNPFPVSNDLVNAWTPTNTSSNIPSWDATNIDSGDISDRFLRDASFVRLRNLTFGYDVPAKFLKQTFIKGCRFRLQGENILTWTKWKGFDPETFTTAGTGYFPTPKVYTFGVDINF